MKIELPKDFDPIEYFALNPDVKNAGVNACEHYINNGFNESRLHKLNLSIEFKNLISIRKFENNLYKQVQPACLMMQKNEGELLRSWILYHSNLFGINNLWIYDNGSDEPNTVQILKTYSALGANVMYDKNKSIDFERKGEIILKTIKYMDELSLYSHYLPLDCDEFVAVKLSDNSYSVSQEEIFAELKKYINAQDVLMILGELVNNPNSENEFIFEKNRKSFFARETANFLDIGFHWGETKFGKDELLTNIIHFHLQNKPLKSLIYSAKEKLKMRLNNFSTESLKSYTGNGHHLPSYFLMTETEYQNKYHGKNLIVNNSLRESFIDLGIDWPYKNMTIPDFKSPIQQYLQHLSFPQNLNIFFANLVNDSSSVLEYGSGSSTKFISNTSKYLLSVESDKNFIDNLARQLNEINPQNNVTQMYIDIGETKEWGYPLNNSHQSSWYLYPTKPWHLLKNSQISPDLVLIDGRFRTACMLATMAYISQPTKIIFDDYIDRPYKKIVENFCKPLEIIDRAAYFEISPNMLSAKDILEHFKTFFDPS